MHDEDQADELDEHEMFRAAIARSLKQLHADPDGEWRAHVGPLIVFMGSAISKLAILTGEADGIADLMAGGAEPRVFDQAADALATVVLLLAGMAQD